MRRTERVVGVDVAQGSQFSSQCLIVFFLTDVAAAVLEHHHFARADFDTFSPVGFQRNRTTQQFRKAFGHRCKGIFRTALPFSRPAKVRGHHHCSARIARRAYARHRSANAGVVGYRAVVILGNVEICAYEYTLAGKIKLGEFSDLHGPAYFAATSATVVSSMRLENPHSLSYQDDTFTSTPSALVRVASKIDEAGLLLKSEDTSGSVL
jgi:hypothetical protein